MKQPPGQEKIMTGMRIMVSIVLDPVKLTVIAYNAPRTSLLKIIGRIGSSIVFSGDSSPWDSRLSEPYQIEDVLYFSQTFAMLKKYQWHKQVRVFWKTSQESISSIFL